MVPAENSLKTEMATQGQFEFFCACHKFEFALCTTAKVFTFFLGCSLFITMVTSDWKTSVAKAVIEDDLQEGILPAHAEELGPKEAWDHVCSHLVEFHSVEHTQFRTNLSDMRKNFRKK